MAKENTMGNCPDQALVQRAKNGDTDALAQLITRFLPLIKNRAARYSFVGLEQDDFVQEGLIGLFTAVKNYDAGRSASFRTYANLCIHSRMVSCLNDLLSKKHLPLNDYLPIDSLNTSHQEILSQGVRPTGDVSSSGGSTDQAGKNQNSFVWIRTGNLNIVPQRPFL